MRKRSILNRGNRKKKTRNLDLDITSLLDVLVILLIFLLKSYSSSTVVLSAPEDIVLPRSESLTPNQEALLVQVSPTTIWVDQKVVVDIKEGGPPRTDQGNRRILALYNELVRKKRIINETATRAKNAKPFSGLVNLMIDKSIKYDYLRKLLYTCAEAGYKKYNLVVMGEEG